MSFKYSRSSNKLTGAALTVVLGVLAFGNAGCRQVRGRKQIQEANELYKRGKYAEAVTAFEAAEALVPEIPILWLNKGYTCRQLIAPGGKDAASKQAATCALDAFDKLRALRPSDPRAEQLTIQTWFDTDDFRALEQTFLERNRRNPDDVEAVRGLQEVYFKWGKWREALDWSKRAAALRPADAETQYGVGTFVWQLLSSKGGGGQMAAFNPWPSPEHPRPEPPAAASGDISGEERVALADVGISYLHRALSLRPRYPEAMTYLALLWRQKSFGLVVDPIAWQGAVDEADEWQRRATLARGGKG
jgi:tetratricopeptide (TPR) repeat protein